LGKKASGGGGKWVTYWEKKLTRKRTLGIEQGTPFPLRGREKKRRKSDGATKKAPKGPAGETPVRRKRKRRGKEGPFSKQPRGRKKSCYKGKTDSFEHVFER